MNYLCPSDDALMELLADELTAAEEELLECHVAGCDVCQVRLERLTNVEKLPRLPANEADSNPACGHGGVLKRMADFAEEQHAIRIPESSSLPSHRRAQVVTSSCERRETGKDGPQASGQYRASEKLHPRGAAHGQVTLLTCGCPLFDSEDFLKKVQIEDQADLLRTFMQTCEQAVRLFGGSIVQCSEEGLVACFGYPVAFEDAALRAARAALQLSSDIKDVSDRFQNAHGLHLEPWIGLHTGPAVVEMYQDNVSLAGKHRKLTARWAVAESGQVVCSGTTHRLITDQFKCTSLGRRKISGAMQGVEVFAVHAVKVDHSRADQPSLTGLTPLTGRDDDVSVLKDP